MSKFCIRVMNKYKNPFEVEDIRSQLAEKQDFSSLMKTYSGLYHEIKDLNTSDLWNHLNTTVINKKDPMAQDRIKIVARSIQGNKNIILNVGFGSANLEKEYFYKNKYLGKWYGIDISSDSVKKARRKFPKINFNVGTITEIKYKKDFFDYVIALEVLEHIRPSLTLKSLSEIFRVLKPKGFFILSVPLNEGLELMIGKGENPNAHVRIYTKSLIKAELKLSGFRIMKETELYAFNKYYFFKKFIIRYLFRNIRMPNNIIIIAQKP